MIRKRTHKTGAIPEFKSKYSPPKKVVVGVRSIRINGNDYDAVDIDHILDGEVVRQETVCMAK